MTLAEQRANIAATLTSAGVRAHDHLPGRITPPVALVGAGSPYLESGDTYGSVLARWEVVLIVGAGDNSIQTDTLDDMTEDCLVALIKAGFRIESVNQPYLLAYNNAEFPATTITTIQTITF